jgi:4-hydroxy-2-oxoheptanedioate aldolase
LRQRFAAREPAFGVTCSTSPFAAEALSRSGFDFVIVDTEHGAISIPELLPFLLAVERGDASPVVRVPWAEPAAIMRALDVGAHGIVAPLVDTAEQARTVAVACRYPPDGRRSFGQLSGTIRGVVEANRELVCIVMVESAEGVANIDEIAAVPGVDAVLLGPADLSLSLGVQVVGSADPTNDRLLAAVDRVVEACERHGVAAGWWLAGEEAVTIGLRHGLRLFIPGADLAYIRDGAAADAASLRALAAPG